MLDGTSSYKIPVELKSLEDEEAEWIKSVHTLKSFSLNWNMA
jgi:hypothetical protein